MLSLSLSVVFLLLLPLLELFLNATGQCLPEVSDETSMLQIATSFVRKDCSPQQDDCDPGYVCVKRKAPKRKLSVDEQMAMTYYGRNSYNVEENAIGGHSASDFHCEPSSSSSQDHHGSEQADPEQEHLEASVEGREQPVKSHMEQVKAKHHSKHHSNIQDELPSNSLQQLPHFIRDLKKWEEWVRGQDEQQLYHRQMDHYLSDAFNLFKAWWEDR
eukprot:gnl/TRDRNA2_/TRDRNA2_188738_c0_seq1.p1 gnl/TRDRNA2_/TRDRNA2_188738_c0~~gnl/TRDRNA2_/TRDRNA2_188738_c0_seq1.p1  ORF type:complete len:216 (-),score=31.77 gnl/TRDRNA2_/TRDRNA2_188738_c0_seq1:109-756(-)